VDTSPKPSFIKSIREADTFSPPASKPLGVSSYEPPPGSGSGVAGLVELAEPAGQNRAAA